MLMHLRPSNRQERCDMLTVDLRESIRKSCAAALGNLSYVKYAVTEHACCFCQSRCGRLTGWFVLAQGHACRVSQKWRPGNADTTCQLPRCQQHHACTLIPLGTSGLRCDRVSLHCVFEQISCATGLCNVSASPATRKRMVELGCVPVIVALGRSNPLETSKQDCARALCNLTCEVSRGRPKLFRCVFGCEIHLDCRLCRVCSLVARCPSSHKALLVDL
jgi:hypothetical protein